MVEIDMEMPETCEYCPLCVDDMCCLLNKLMEWGDRLQNCPLTEVEE